MDKNMQVFDFQGKNLDYGIFEGEPVFNLNYIAGLLEIENPRMSIDVNNTNYVVKIRNSVVSFTYNRNVNNRGELFLTEAGLYRLVLRSNKPEAEPFILWVTKEVLPSIRKNGKYAIEWHTARAINKVIRRTLTDSIKENCIDPENPKNYIYKHYTDLSYMYVFGVGTKKLRKLKGLDKNANIKKYLSIEELKAVEKAEKMITGLLDNGLSYEEVKDMLEQIKIRKLNKQ